ncbi:MAG: hypothetical protein U1E62_12160 [Alsobacter sp.]
MRLALGWIAALAAAFGGLAAGQARAGEPSCQAQEIAPGVKMRAANCPTLIGRPAAVQSRTDMYLQAPAGLSRYSDVEMKVTAPRMGSQGLGAGGTAGLAGPAGGRRP